MTDRVTQIRFDALRNAIYHTSRRSFLETLNRSLSFVIVAGGTAAVADLGRHLGFDIAPMGFAAVAALGGLFQLVFDLPGLARTHEFLQRRFYELVAEIVETGSPAEADLARWEGALNRLYAEEKPPMRALDAISYNAAVDNMGFDRKNRISIRWWHSVFRQVWPFNETAF